MLGRCKACHRESVAKNREDKKEYYAEYDRKRFREDPRVRKRHREYQKTESGKAAMLEARKRYLAKNPEKRAAHVILGNAVRDGRVVKPTTCSECGAGGRIHGHHEDYAKPLEVEWLCPSCHMKRHY